MDGGKLVFYVIAVLKFIVKFLLSVTQLFYDGVKCAM